MSDDSVPLPWIKLELIPLPGIDPPLSQRVLWWNPEARHLIGEGADEVLIMIHQAAAAGVVKGAMLNHFEITDPLYKPSELAAILAQYFWVIPEPVATPEMGGQNDELLPTLQ